jgi:hypothetical protein
MTLKKRATACQNINHNHSKIIMCNLTLIAIAKIANNLTELNRIYTGIVYSGICYIEGTIHVCKK